MERKELCNENCNECPIISHPNSRILTWIFNKLFLKYGNEVYKIVQDKCPNLTACFDCRIDDFVHCEDCSIIKDLEK